MKDKLAAYSLDRAVVLFGTTIESALMERTEPNDQGETYPIYELVQLLTPGFQLPRKHVPAIKPSEIQGIHGFVYDEIK